MWGLVAALGLAAVLAAVLLTRRRKHTTGEAESKRVEMSPELTQFVIAVNSENDRSSPAFIRAVDQMRSSSEELLAEAGRLLAVDADSSFEIRHCCLLAVAALRTPAALDLLSMVALNPQPLPPKQAGRAALNPQPLPPVDDPRRFERRDGHGGEAWVAGTMLALAALDGIKALADDGHAAANEALVRAAGIESNAVRAVALAALGADPGRSDYLERAVAGLPSGLKDLAQTRFAEVRNVPQVKDPRAHLAGAETRTAAPPDPDGDGGETRQAAAAGRGAPRVGRS